MGQQALASLGTVATRLQRKQFLRHPAVQVRQDKHTSHSPRLSALGSRSLVRSRMLKSALQIYLEQTWQGELHRKSDNKLLSYLFWANRILLVYVPIQQRVSAWVLLSRWLLLLPVILAGRMCRIYRHSMAYSKWHCPLVPKSQCAQSTLARRAHSTRRCVRVVATDFADTRALSSSPFEWCCN